MNVHINLLDYAAELEKAGIARPHAEAIAQLQARAIRDLIDHELVTKDFLRAELTVLKSEMRDAFRKDIDGLRAEIRKDIDGLRVEIRKDIDGLRVEIRKDIDGVNQRIDALTVQLRSLQFGGAIAAFALGVVVLLSRLIGS